MPPLHYSKITLVFVLALAALWATPAITALPNLTGMEVAYYSKYGVQPVDRAEKLSNNSACMVKDKLRNINLSDGAEHSDQLSYFK